jgi:hypothetical protein
VQVGGEVQKDHAHRIWDDIRVSDSIISSCAATFRPLTGAHAAAAQLPDWCVVDGELVALDEAGRLSFDLLQRRLVTSSARARRPVPAGVAGGVDAALQLTPVNVDVDEAREWYEVVPGAMGVEGLVIKARHGGCQPGRREWWKVNSLGVGGVGLGLGLTGCEVSTDSGFLASWANSCRGR